MLTHNLNMFLDLQGSCDKNKMKAEKKLTTEMWSQFFAREASFGCRKFKRYFL